MVSGTARRPTRWAGSPPTNTLTDGSSSADVEPRSDLDRECGDTCDHRTESSTVAIDVRNELDNDNCRPHFVMAL